MNHHRWHIPLAFCLGLSWSTAVVGCRGVHGDVRGTALKTVVPPLSSASSGIVPAGGINLGTAPAQLASGNKETATATSEPFIPAMPQSAEAAAKPQMLATPMSQPFASRPVPLPASNPGQIQQVRNTTDCLPPEAEWRKQMEEQTAALLKRLTQVEGELTSTRSSLQAVNQSLQASQGQINQLNQEVTRWKNEVQRLEADMKAQQLADLKSLDELTESMHQVITKQRPASTSMRGHAE